MGDTESGSWGSDQLLGFERREEARGCGANYPCARCGMSQRNTVHTNPAQFGYHGYEDRIEDADADE